MANAALLGGLLKGFGAAQAHHADQQFQAEQQAKAQRLSILQAAVTNPNLDPRDLPGIFQQMDEIYSGSGSKGKGSGSGGGGKSKPGGLVGGIEALFSHGAPAAAPQASPAASAGAGTPAAAASQSAPQAAPQATPPAAPPSPPGFLQRIGHGISSEVGKFRSGFAGAGNPQTQAAPPPPPISILTPEQRATQMAQAQFKEQNQENSEIQQIRTKQADNVGLEGDARQAFILEGKLPPSFGSTVLRQIGKPVPLGSVPAGSVNPDGSPFDPHSIPGGTLVQLTQAGDQIIATPVGVGPASASSISGQLQAAFAALQNPQTSPSDRQAAVLTIQHYDPTRVRTNATTHFSTITLPDGSTKVVATPVTSTSTTSAPTPAAAPAPGEKSKPSAARLSATPPAPPQALSSTGQAHPIAGLEGHKALPAQAERQLSGAATLSQFADDVVAALQAAGANPNDNSWLSRLRGTAQQLLYNQGFDTALSPVSNLSGLMQAMAAATIGTGRMNSQLLDIAGLHVPGANQTPAAIAARAALVKHAAQTVMKQIGNEYGVDVDQNGHPTMRSAAPPAPQVNPALKSSHPKAYEWLQGVGGGR